MGYDIKLIKTGLFLRLYVIDGKFKYPNYDVERPDAEEETYLPYNFNREPIENYWVPRSCFGHLTDTTIPILQKVANRLFNEGIAFDIPAGCDGWTCQGPQGLIMFHYHVRRLLQLFKDNPGCVILADVDHGIYFFDDKSDDESDDKDTTELPKLKDLMIEKNNYKSLHQSRRVS